MCFNHELFPAAETLSLLCAVVATGDESIKMTKIKVCIYCMAYLDGSMSYCIAGNFQGEISLWFSIIKFICGKKNSLVYSLVSSQLNHKIKSSWVKHSWFYSNHKNHEDISP